MYKTKRELSPLSLKLPSHTTRSKLTEIHHQENGHAKAHMFEAGNTDGWQRTGTRIREGNVVPDPF